MEPQEYIKRFRMDQENYRFSRPEFLKQLYKDLLEEVKNHPKRNPETGFIKYKHFKECVKVIYAKYWAISRAMPHGNLSPNLWHCFFAMYVVKYRTENYPECQDHIIQVRIRDGKKVPKSQLNKTSQND